MGTLEDFDHAFGGDDDEPPFEVVEDGAEQEDTLLNPDAEIDRRLAKAPYYRAIINNGIVEDDGSDISAEINAEFAELARERLRDWLGVGKPKVETKVELPFTPEEVQKLKDLAAAATFTENETKALKSWAKNLLAKVGELPSEPAVRRVNVAAPPAAVKRQPVATGPAVRKQQPPAPVAKTESQPQKPKATPKPARQAPKPAQTRSKPKAETTKQAKPVGPVKELPRQQQPIERTEEIAYEQIPLGQVFKDLDGNLYRRVGNPKFDPDVEGSKPWSKIKVTNQVGGIGRVPMPTGLMLTAATEAASAASFELKASGNTVYQDEAGGKDVFALGAIAGLRG